MVLNAGRELVSREVLLHQLYEAAELEHNLMCTYLYAAFSLRQGEAEGLRPDEAPAVGRMRDVIQRVAIEEMGHLAAVWNITSALGGAPRFGRGNFPLDPGYLPARLVVRLAPFDEAVLQHFVHLERPVGSSEPEGSGFEPTLLFTRAEASERLVPIAVDYDTVGAFYATLDERLRAFVAAHGESVAFCGDPALQLSSQEVDLPGAQPVRCEKTAHAAFTAIVQQGEGAPEHSEDSHFARFATIRAELAELRAKNPDFRPSFPAAVNPVLRRPFRPEGRVWIEHPEAGRTVDLANASYALMLRLLAHAYSVPRPLPEKSLAVELAVGSMRAVAALGEHAARLPAGESHPGCNAGVSFTSLRDAAALPPGPSSWRFFDERLGELARAAAALAADAKAPRVEGAARVLADLARRAERGVALSRQRAAPAASTNPPVQAPPPAAASTPRTPASSPPPAAPLPASALTAPRGTPPVPVVIDGVEHVEGEHLTLLYEGQRCIHARFCVTGAPGVFLANVQGPWIVPDAIDVEALAGIAHACPSGAIRYRRKDGRPDETPPPVNLIATREAGPYAVRGDIELDGKKGTFRATLCRCGASKKKPFCDGSHHEVGFAASGEPPTGERTAMLEVRDGPLRIDPELDGPLAVRGNVELTSGTGRVVARLTATRLCRCGHSNTKPFCDGTHKKVGFRST